MRARPAVDDAAGVRARRCSSPSHASIVIECAATLAQGGYGPDLTHLMSRQTLAAGMVPNTLENLRRWVDDPNSIKPGCLMPAFGLSQRDRGLIVDYLKTLR